jgi:outer membrane protein TolC
MMQYQYICSFAVFAAVLLLQTGSAAGTSDGLWDRADSLEAAYRAADDVDIDSGASLETYLRVAAGRNPALRSMFYRWKSALGHADVGGTLPDPVISYRYFIENVETRVGPQNQGLSLRQDVPWPGMLSAQSDVALEDARIAFRRFQAAMLEVVAQVKGAYYEYYLVGREAALTEENLSLMTFWESVVRTKYKAALAGNPDLLRVQVELGKLEDHLATLNAAGGPAAARLRAAVNLPDSIPVPIPQAVDVSEQTYDADSVRAAVLRANPDLLSRQHAVAREEAGLRLARRSALPNFSLGVDYIDTGPAMNPGTPESGKDPWIVGLSVSLPLWFGKNASRTDEAEAREYEARYAVDEVRNRLLAMAERLLFEHGDALRKVHLYRDGLIPKAVQSLNTSYAAYQAGEVDFLNVLDAQRRVLEFQLQLERARVDLGNRAAALDALMGGGSPAPEH